MKRLLKALAIVAGMSAVAAEPLCWVRVPNKPAPAQFDTFHGEALEFRCTFAGFGDLLDQAGWLVSPRLYYQTNGMGNAWWSLQATVSNNTVSASFPPNADPGVERLTVFFGAPSNAYAAAQVRFLNSPGPNPTDLAPPEPFNWRSELANAILALDESLSADLSRAALNGTNYTDATAATLRADMAQAAQAGTNYTATTTSALGSALRGEMARAAQAGTNYTDATSSAIRAEMAQAAQAGTNYTAATTGALGTALRSEMATAAQAGTNYTDATASAIRADMARAALDGTNFTKEATSTATETLRGEIEAVAQSAMNATVSATNVLAGVLRADMARAALDGTNYADGVGAQAVQSAGEYTDVQIQDLRSAISGQIPGTNGFVTAAITNGLASKAYADAQIAATAAAIRVSISVVEAKIPGTNGFVTAAITNGLATKAYADAQIAATAAAIRVSMAGVEAKIPGVALAGTNFTVSATNALAGELRAEMSGITPGNYVTVSNLAMNAITNHQSLAGYATEQWVKGQGFLTNHQSLVSYAQKTWVQSQGYMTQSQASGLIKANVYDEVQNAMDDVLIERDIARRLVSTNGLEWITGDGKKSVVTEVYDGTNFVGMATNTYALATMADVQNVTNVQSATFAGHADSADNAENATRAGLADLAGEASYALNLIVEDTAETRSAQQIFSALDSKVTTNDVCNIVTNVVVTEYGHWSAPGLPWYEDIPSGYTGNALSGFWQIKVGGEEGQEAWNFEYTVYEDGEGIIVRLLDEDFIAPWTATSIAITIDQTSYTLTRSAKTRNSLGLARLSDVPSTNGLASVDDVYRIVTNTVTDVRYVGSTRVDGTNYVFTLTNFEWYVSDGAYRVRGVVNDATFDGFPDDIGSGVTPTVSAYGGDVYMSIPYDGSTTTTPDMWECRFEPFPGPGASSGSFRFNAAISTRNALGLARLTDIPSTNGLATKVYVDEAIAAAGGGEWVETNVTATMQFVTGYEHVTLPSGGTLTADVTDWPNGAALMVDLVPGGTYTVSGITMLGYQTWPTNRAEMVVFRSGTNMFANVILTY